MIHTYFVIHAFGLLAQIVFDTRSHTVSCIPCPFILYRMGNRSSAVADESDSDSSDVPDYYRSHSGRSSPEPFEVPTGSRKFPAPNPQINWDMSCEINGTDLSGYIVPEEVLSIILSKVDLESLPTCRSVCRTWKYIIDNEIWRHIFHTKFYQCLISACGDEKFTFPIYYTILKKKPFNRNLIKNPCGRNKFSCWKLFKDGWSDGWAVEDPPAGADPVPVNNVSDDTCCFSTSFSLCAKEQTIDLEDVGIVPLIMDKIKPTIYVSEWYAARFDCGSQYTLHVKLLDENGKILEECVIERRVDQWQGREWNQVSHEFQNYKTGVRYISFYHSGKDTQFWKGHYGSKMTQACVKVIL